MLETERQDEKKFLSLGRDSVFKYLFKNEKTRGWFEEIIRKKFHFNLEGFKLLDNELNTGNHRKDYRLDLCLQKENEIVIIEMNQEYSSCIEVKSYQYLYRVAGMRYAQGENYHKKKTTLILWNCFRNKKYPKMKTAKYEFVDQKSGSLIQDIQSFELYLPNFKEACYDKEEVDVSLSLFTCKSYEEMRKKTKNPKDLKIIKELEELSMWEIDGLTEEDWENVRRKTENSIREEAYENGLKKGERRGEKIGEKIGEKKGTYEAKVKMAKSLLEDENQFSNEFISKHTKLSIQEIEKIKSTIQI